MKCKKCGHENDKDARFCEKCGEDLIAKPDNKINVKKIVYAGVLILVLIAFSWLLYDKYKNHPQDDPEPIASKKDVILVIAGSNTIGADLIPKLSKKYLETQVGAKDVKIEKKDAEGLEQIVKGVLGNDTIKIEISSHGSGTAFKRLKKDSADIGMSSRQIKDDEITENVNKLKTSEHILAMDGIAVIVNETNPINEITITQIADIFSGSIMEWSAITSTSGRIEVLARDEKSGTWEYFEQIILKKFGKTLINDAKRFESTSLLSDEVAKTKDAVGFVSASKIGNAKALKIYEQGTKALLPSHFTISTEDYLLSRRLFLYTSINTQNQHTKAFIDFCLGYQGQEIVKTCGFIPLIIECDKLPEPIADAKIPKEYRELYNSDVCRLSVNLRFKVGSNELDNKALKDLNRIVEYLSNNSGKTVVLCGFTDNTGSEESNIKLSIDRATIVQKEFDSRGIKATIIGCGATSPIADNSSEVGREKNRRVEVWIK